MPSEKLVPRRGFASARYRRRTTRRYRRRTTPKTTAVVNIPPTLNHQNLNTTEIKNALHQAQVALGNCNQQRTANAAALAALRVASQTKGLPNNKRMNLIQAAANAAVNHSKNNPSAPSAVSSKKGIMVGLKALFGIGTGNTKTNTIATQAINQSVKSNLSVNSTKAAINAAIKASSAAQKENILANVRQIVDAAIKAALKVERSNVSPNKKNAAVAAATTAAATSAAANGNPDASAQAAAAEAVKAVKKPGGSRVGSFFRGMFGVGGGSNAKAAIANEAAAKAVAANLSASSTNSAIQASIKAAMAAERNSILTNVREIVNSAIKAAAKVEQSALPNNKKPAAVNAATNAAANATAQTGGNATPAANAAAQAAVGVAQGPNATPNNMAKAATAAANAAANGKNTPAAAANGAVVAVNAGLPAAAVNAVANNKKNLNTFLNQYNANRRKAWLKAVKVIHPNKGGNTAQFQRLSTLYNKYYKNLPAPKNNNAVAVPLALPAPPKKNNNWNLPNPGKLNNNKPKKNNNWNPNTGGLFNEPAAAATAAVAKTNLPNNKKNEVVAAVAKAANNNTPAEVKAVVAAAIEAAKKGNNVNKAANAIAEVHNQPVAPAVKNAAVNAAKKNNNKPAAQEAAANATAAVAKTNLPNNKKAAVVEAAVNAVGNAAKKNNTPAEVKAVVNAAIAAAIKTAQSPNATPNKMEKAANAAANAVAKGNAPKAAVSNAVAAANAGLPAAAVNKAANNLNSHPLNTPMPGMTANQLKNIIRITKARVNKGKAVNGNEKRLANAQKQLNNMTPANAAAAKKSLANFFKNYQIVGYPKNLVTNVTANKSSNFARRFLYSKLSAGRNMVKQITPYGSKYANKHPWANIVTKLNNYNLTNAQKNMLRRVNIAIAAQPKVSGLGGKRNAVVFNIAGLSRNNAIAKQKNALSKRRPAFNNNTNKKNNKKTNNAANKKRQENENMKKFLATGGF